MAVVLTISLGARPSPELVQAALVGLTEACYVQLQRRPLPPLYSTRVRYQRELGRERWQTAEETFRRGVGDCEDLAAWRCAECWVSGERGARAICYAPRPGLIHCVVRRANGSIDDPSKRLGMGAG